MSSISLQDATGGESFADLFAQSVKNQDMKSGEVISAEVVRVDHNFVVVNAGLKSESLIPLEEFLNDQGELEVAEGDFVSVAIDSLENGYGDTILSRDRAKRLSAWLSLEKALESGEMVTGTITGKVKGGLTVMTNGIRAFLPGSLVDLRPVKDTTPYEGKTMEFKVIKLDRKRNNVVLSRRSVLEVNMGEERQKLLENLKEGAVVTGVVKNITDYGAFVDLGGIDGLLHITDMAWRRVRHPSEVLSVGQEVQAKVLKFDQDKSRVSLASNSWAKIHGSVWHVAIRKAHACSVKSPILLTTVRLLKSKPVSKVWYTFPKWTGPTKTLIRAKWLAWAKKLKSWFWKSTKIVVVFHLA